MNRPSSTSHRELAQRIREGNQKRLEEQRKLKVLRQAYHESRQEEQRSKGKNGPTAYLPLILVFLLFVSFPLSEQVVDWNLVGVFATLNLLCGVAVSEPSHWMNVLLVVLANLVLVRFSPYLYDVPALVRTLSPVATALYLVGNALLSALLYYGYVEQRLFFRRRCRHEVPTLTEVGAPSAPNGGGPATRGVKHEKGDSNATDVETLRAFVQEAERVWRADVAGSILLLVNIAALTYSGILPRELIAQAVRNAFRLVS